MKHAAWSLALLITLLITGTAKAQNYQTALGIRLSSNDAVVNNSVSFKHFFNNKLAGEALLSFSPLAVGALLEAHQPLNLEGLSLFYGGGAFAGFTRFRNAGAMGIVGLDYKFNGVPINLSLDWKPELSIVREFSFEPAAIGLSIRFVFR